MRLSFSKPYFIIQVYGKKTALSMQSVYFLEIFYLKPAKCYKLLV